MSSVANKSGYPVDAVTQVETLYADASSELVNQGAFFTRPYGIWADMAFKKDEQTTKLLKNIKKTFDPQGIMNPGKLCFNANFNTEA